MTRSASAARRLGPRRRRLVVAPPQDLAQIARPGRPGPVPRVLTCVHAYRPPPPASVESVIERYQNFSAAQKYVHGKSLPEQSNSKGSEVTRATTDRGLKFDDLSIDESSIFQSTVEQVSQIERELEDALSGTMARKLSAGWEKSTEEGVVSAGDPWHKTTTGEYVRGNIKTQLMDRIARLQEKGKTLPEERNFMDMISRQEEKVQGNETGSQHSNGEVDALLSLNIGADCNGRSHIGMG